MTKECMKLKMQLLHLSYSVVNNRWNGYKVATIFYKRLTSMLSEKQSKEYNRGIN